MIVLIIQIVAGIAAYYFMKKKLAERYTADFIKSVKWILISPIVQIVVFVPACISAIMSASTINAMVRMRSIGGLEQLLGIEMSGFLARPLSYDEITSLMSNPAFESLAKSVVITIAVGWIAAILFTIMVIKQYRDILGQGSEKRLKTTHKVSLLATFAVEACLTWVAVNACEYMFNSPDDSSKYVPYITFIIVILVLGALSDKFVKVVPHYFAQRDADMAAKQAAEERPSTTAAPSTSTAEQLQELKKMLDQGILTQQEFDNEKRKLLNK